jgi:hypothetical protein
MRFCGWIGADDNAQKAMTIGYFAEIKGLVGYQ